MSETTPIRRRGRINNSRHLSLLKEKNVTAAVVVDDAYDLFPKADDLAAAGWNSFFDDISDDDEQKLQGLVGKLYDDLSVPELAANDLFVRTLWENRDQIAPSGTIFAVYEETQKQKRTVLAPLLTLLTNEFGLTCKTVGRDATLDEMQAQIVFLDLYLGFVQRKDAIKNAGDKLRKLIHANPAAPPSVILLSASSELHDLAPGLRDDAEVLGCQFRWIDKDHLNNQDLVSEKLYDLVISHVDAVTLNQFVLAWSSALDRSKKLFMKNIRSLDLADYANVNPLEGANCVHDLVERYLALQPHEHANLSVVLYNCDSSRLPQAVVEKLAPQRRRKTSAARSFFDTEMRRGCAGFTNGSSVNPMKIQMPTARVRPPETLWHVCGLASWRTKPPFPVRMTHARTTLCSRRTSSPGTRDWSGIGKPQPR